MNSKKKQERNSETLLKFQYNTVPLISQYKKGRKVKD